MIDKYRQRVEVYVTDSDLIMPGQSGNLIAKINKNDEKIIINNIQVLAARWKISFSARKEGFVTLSVSQKQQKLFKTYSNFVLRKSK